MEAKQTDRMSFTETLRHDLGKFKRHFCNSETISSLGKVKDDVLAIINDKSIQGNFFQRCWRKLKRMWKEEDIRRQLWILLESVVTMVVILNYFVVMLSTYSEIQQRHAALFIWVERAFVAIYVLEITVRIRIEKKWFHFFWLEPEKTGDEIRKAKIKLFWNYFDFLITVLSCIFIGSNPALSSVRVLRCFRLFSLVSKSKNLRMISSAIIDSMKSITWAGVMLIVIFYIFSVFGCELYSNSGFFDNAGQGMITLFHMMTLDDAATVMQQLSGGNYYTHIFFFIFIIITAFVIMNVITGAIVQSVMNAGNKIQKESKCKRTMDLGKNADAEPNEIEELKSKVAELQQLLAKMSSKGINA